MKRITIGICLLFFSQLVWAKPEQTRFHPSNMFIKLKKGQKLKSSPFIRKARNIIGNIYLVNSSNPLALAQEFQRDATVEYVKRDTYTQNKNSQKFEKLIPEDLVSTYVLKNKTLSSDPALHRLWAFGKNGMDITAAYKLLGVLITKKVTVAVIDTGVDFKHEDLKDVMWRNPYEIEGDGIDNDENGYVDDVFGINTLIRDQNGNATTNVKASHWHGTHVAGIIGATHNNNMGIAGVANNVEIMAIRAVPDSEDELDSNIVEGLIYAAKMGAKIINCSFGKNHNEGGMVVRDVINEIGTRYGVLVVAASGNDGGFDIDHTLKYPASFDSPNMLVVASYDDTEIISEFSNIGPESVDVAAPGSGIYSTINGNRYSYASGTSMAAPHVSGAAAVVWGQNPLLSVQELKDLLMNTVEQVPAFQGLMVSPGKVNLKKALIEAIKLK